MSVTGVAVDTEQDLAALEAEMEPREEETIPISQASPSLFLALPVYLLAKLMILPKEQSISLLDTLRQHDLPGADEAGATVRDAAAALSDFRFQEGLRLTRSALNSFVDAVEKGDETHAAEEFRAFSGMLAAIPWSPKLSLTALAGLVETVLSGNMPEASYLARLRLHNTSDNAFNELAAATMAERRPVKESPPSPIDHGLLGKATARMAGDALRISGLHLFENRLSAGLCDRLEEFARRAPVLVVRGDGSSTPASQAILDDPTVDGCYVDPQHLVDNVDIQKLLMDQGLWTVARNYLGCEPICVGPNLWWSLPSARSPSDTLAQYHHWDAGWLNWVNIFIYLTDCMSPTDGAHVFVRGTHRRGAKPEELRRRFYARIPDEDIVAHHGVENLVTLTGPRGTAFAEDTRGWHKGSRPTTRSRLLLQINFADTLLLSKMFYDRKLRLPKNPCSDFARFLADRPEAFSPLYYDRA